MAFISRKFFVASLIYLLLGLLAQAVGVVDAWLGFNPLAYTTITATQQFLLLGWLTQLGLAFVYERLERTPAAALTSSKFPNRKMAMTVFILFNVGLVLVIIGQPGLALFGGSWLGAMAALGGLLQLSAGILFTYQTWQTLKN